MSYNLEELYERHLDDCDYCERISKNLRLSDEQRNFMIDQHALSMVINEAADRYDNAYDAWKEEHDISELTLKTL